jgi:hypothetical protein
LIFGICVFSAGVAAIPNFYSNSLCRKANASHLKKHAQKGKDPEPVLTVPAPAQPPRRLRAVASDGAISSALAMSASAANTVNLKQTQDTLEMATQVHLLCTLLVFSSLDMIFLFFFFLLFVFRWHKLRLQLSSAPSSRV